MPITLRRVAIFSVMRGRVGSADDVIATPESGIGTSVLWLAALAGSTTMVRSLLDRGIDALLNTRPDPPADQGSSSVAARSFIKQIELASA